MSADSSFHSARSQVSGCSMRARTASAEDLADKMSCRAAAKSRSESE